MAQELLSDHLSACGLSEPPPAIDVPPPHGEAPWYPRWTKWGENGRGDRLMPIHFDPRTWRPFGSINGYTYDRLPTSVQALYRREWSGRYVYCGSV